MERTSKLDNTDAFASEQSKIDSIRLDEAVRKWVNQFNRIPSRIIEKLHEFGDEIIEITPPIDNEAEFYYNSLLPIWGTMWAFDDPADNQWLDDKNNQKAMADCGFRIYKQEDLGYIFGIHGAGYDFFGAHWIPLYKARGLMWHL